MYCIECERNLTVSESWESLAYGYHSLSIGDEWIGCHGEFTSSAPPELPEDWELNLEEPDADEWMVMELNAKSLLLEMAALI